METTQLHTEPTTAIHHRRPRVLVGATPRSPYATWKDHRLAMRRAAEGARAARAVRRA
ncbi:hypothetical protein [Natronorarus salvus]|uniref:hypothetical protein n=1 Tax=Natronorarus salvus TaxID=3117733 RepID=UPI002F269D1A